IPDHAWAMRAGMIDASVSIELDYNQALEYLKGGALYVAPGFQGWAVVKYLGISLGWIKCVQGRTNNYYPKGWRLRTG
ncbi:MAG: hypothetical protein JNM00_07755, partial [Flavobacteriales bacterium]|nr:hypothetical protein [Flavobacteriales bacterium]